MIIEGKIIEKSGSSTIRTSSHIRGSIVIGKSMQVNNKKFVKIDSPLTNESVPLSMYSSRVNSSNNFGIKS